MAAVGSLEEEALKRRARLKALQNKRTVGLEPDSKKSKHEESEPKRVSLKFRSYKPKDESLQEKQLPGAKPDSLAAEVEEKIKAATQDDNKDAEINLLSLAPKKPDWDLKRDVTKKLERVERRTQRAIVDLIRLRLEKGEVNLAEAVLQTQNKKENDDDDDD
ncbi:coiled-coil domain-containing protein 12-like [Oscarella lobularis]|uniref:coiled-coil domain-containing protein 12-like n=1 Tax=Oscarella lobularis TaxID=121494 RepID=UPI003313A398